MSCAAISRGCLGLQWFIRAASPRRAPCIKGDRSECMTGGEGKGGGEAFYLGADQAEFMKGASHPLALHVAPYELAHAAGDIIYMSRSLLPRRRAIDCVVLCRMALCRQEGADCGRRSLFGRLAQGHPFFTGETTAPRPLLHTRYTPCPSLHSGRRQGSPVVPRSE